MTQSEWAGEPTESAPPPPMPRDELTTIDLDTIERDLRDVESALARLADGTYFPQPGASVPGTNAPGSPPVALANDPAVDTDGQPDDTVGDKEVDG